MALGLVAGLTWAFEHPREEPAACRVKTATQETLGDCMGDALLAAAVPYVVWVGAGILIGTAAGVVLGRLLFPPALTDRRPAEQALRGGMRPPGADQPSTQRS